MLVRLGLRDFALVAALDVEPGEGLCLLTGETGAGKSILVEAVGLLAGQRAESEMVRQGAPSAEVEGLFEPARFRREVAELLTRWSVPFEGEVLVRRKVSLEGRNTIHVNGSTVTLAQLKELGGLLVEVHGQNQGQALLEEESHRAILDSLEAVVPSAEAVRSAAEAVREALSTVRHLRRRESERAQRLDTLVFQREEIDRVGPEAGEEEGLLAEKSRLQNAERIVEAASMVAGLLAGDDASVSAGLSEAARHLRDLADMDPAWRPFIEDLEGCGAVVGTLASEAERTAATVFFDGEALEKIQQRLADLDRLKRKYGPSLSEVLAHREAVEEEYRALSEAGLSMSEAEARLGSAFEDYRRAATELGRLRRAEADSFAAAVESSLRPLAMDKAVFRVEVVPRPAAGPEDVRPEGDEDVRFLFSANAGEQPKPLAKIASGGELSRTLLALLTAQRAAPSPDTVVFDEVDSGIGGRPAERVGRRLRQLASHHQVLCITHLPQIAAFSHWHARVTKADKGGRTTVAVKVLGDAEREREIARMLAGETVGATALDHARTLIRDARAEGANLPF